MKHKKQNSRNRAGGVTLVAGGTILLLAGGGTFAEWYDQHEVTGGTVTTGELALDSLGDATWTINGTEVTSPDGRTLAPGDRIEYTETVQVTLVGANAILTGSRGWFSEDEILEQHTNFTVDGERVGPAGMLMTEADNGDVLDIEWTIEWPEGEADAIDQATDVDLGSVSVELTQVVAGGDTLTDNNGMNYPIVEGERLTVVDGVFSGQDLTWLGDRVNDAYFEWTDFTGANLTGVNMTGWQFGEANNFTGANLTGVTRDGQPITSAFLDSVGATWDETTTFSG